MSTALFVADVLVVLDGAHALGGHEAAVRVTSSAVMLPMRPLGTGVRHKRELLGSDWYVLAQVVESRSKEAEADDGGAVWVSALTLVDLAGSERLGKTGASCRVGWSPEVGSVLLRVLLSMQSWCRSLGCARTHQTVCNLKHEALRVVTHVLRRKELEMVRVMRTVDHGVLCSFVRESIMLGLIL